MISSDFLEELTKVSRKIRTIFNKEVTEHGLTYPRARTLLRLIKKPYMNQSELAFELELEQATMVRLLDRLEENGVIERHPDPNDRRAKLLVLTPHGVEQAELVRSIGKTMRKQMFHNMTEQELIICIKLFHRISSNIDVMENSDASA
ncbi:MarR family transcriptional regulator for hemolysin [Paenochrobactrum gallinarii]|uniref:MarR family transcriptional regulator for hemolysin n=1 Tax=Paenochrobactrum gallinarii TaxID=643673 RepID=A0A841M706_9HYPH|nr:MarR family transcriptional regulator for hemolysin [Paenochrobactrum gallinarii]